MQIARVIGTLVSTQKHRKFEGAKLLIVQPLGPDDAPRGSALLAVDGVGAGVNEKVLIVLEGRAAGGAVGEEGAPVEPDDAPRGSALLAVDGVGAGVNEKVLIVLEGRAAGEALGKKAAPVDAAIVGIIDTVTVNDGEAGAGDDSRLDRKACRPARPARAAWIEVRGGHRISCEPR